jgi:hypothetical protein
VWSWCSGKYRFEASRFLVMYLKGTGMLALDTLAGAYVRTPYYHTVTSVV